MSTEHQVKTREDLLYLLSQAAELEHSLACQYLFTAFSLKESTDEGVSQAQLTRINRWRKTINGIAVQEMLHLALVSNLLTAIGGAPYFRRANFPQAKTYSSIGLVFELSPFSPKTLSRYICFELPNNFQDPAKRERWTQFCQEVRTGEDMMRLFDPADIPARMMKTVDGGATWTAWDMSEYATILIDNYFIDENIGWVVGGKAEESITNPSRDDVIPVVLYTEDGGQTWVNRVADITSFPLGEWGWKIFFLNENIGFVSLENFTKGAILKTIDGGKTWKRLRINDEQENANLEGIGFADENLGWVGGWGDEDFEGGYSSETQDGGENWQDANQIGQFINRFRFFGNPVTVGYASGLTVYKYSTTPVAASLVERVAPPLRFLATNAPAKCDRSVNIEYTVPENTQKVRIDIWNQFGSFVRQLVDESNPSAGQKSVVWEGKNDAGESLPPGIFIYRLTVDGNAESRVIRLNP